MAAYNNDDAFNFEKQPEDDMAGTKSEWDKVTEKLWENGEDFIVMDNKPKEGLTTASQDLMDEIICDMTHLSAKMELLIDLVNSK